jgi:hypothetical protein
MILRSVSGESPAFCMFDPAGGIIADYSALPLAAVQFQALMMVGLLLLLEDPTHENIDWPDYSRCGYGTWDRAIDRTCKRRDLFGCHPYAMDDPSCSARLRHDGSPHPPG